MEMVIKYRIDMEFGQNGKGYIRLLLSKGIPNIEICFHWIGNWKKTL